MKKETLQQAQLLAERIKGLKTMLCSIRDKDSIAIVFHRNEIDFRHVHQIFYDEKFTQMIYKKLVNILIYQIKLSEANFKKLK